MCRKRPNVSTELRSNGLLNDVAEAAVCRLRYNTGVKLGH